MKKFLLQHVDFYAIAATLFFVQFKELPQVTYELKEAETKGLFY